MVKGITVNCHDLDTVLCVGQVEDLDHRNLIQGIAIGIAIGDLIGEHPLASGVLGVAIVGIDHGVLDDLAGGIADLDQDGAGGVAGQTDDIEAGAVEAEVGLAAGIGVDGELGSGTHGEGGHVLVGIIVAVVVVGIQDIGDLACAGAVHILLTVLGHGDPAAVAILDINTFPILGEGSELDEVILVVDGGCGDNGDGGVHVGGIGRAILTVVSHLGLVVEHDGFLELHAVLLIQGEADKGSVNGGGGDLHIVIDADIGALVLCGSVSAGVDGDIVGLITADTHQAGGHRVVGGDIDHHIQTVVHDNGIGNQLGLPDNGEGNGGVGVVHVSGIRDSVAVVAADIGAGGIGVGAVCVIPLTGLGVVDLGGVQIVDIQICIFIVGALCGALDDEVVVICTVRIHALGLIDIDLVVGLVIVQGIDIGHIILCQILSAQLGHGVFTVPDDIVGNGIGDIHGLGEGDLTAGAVDRLTLIVDQVENIGDLRTVPGHGGNGELLLDIVVLVVLVGDLGILVGVIGTGGNLLFNLEAGGMVQIDEVLQCQLGGGQLFSLPGQELLGDDSAHLVQDLAAVCIVGGSAGVFEVGALDFGDSAGFGGHMGTGLTHTGHNAVDEVALQRAVGIEGELLQHIRRAGTLLLSVELILEDLNVELFHAVCFMDSDILIGQLEAQIVVGTDLILDHNIGCGLLDLVDDILEDLGQRADILLDKAGVAGICSGGGIALIITGDLLQQSLTVGGLNDIVAGLGEHLDTDGIDIDTGILHQIGVVLGLRNEVRSNLIIRVVTIDLHIGSRTVIIQVGEAGRGRTVGDEDTVLLPFITLTVGLCRAQNGLTLLQRSLVVGTAICFPAIDFGSHAGQAICVKGLQIAGAVAVGIQAAGEGIDCHAALVKGAVLILDDGIQRRDNGILSGLHTVCNAIGTGSLIHGGGHIDHDDDIDLVVGGVGHAGHAELDLGHTGLGEVTHGGGVLVETDSALVGVIGEVIGAVLGDDVLGGRCVNGDGVVELPAIRSGVEQFDHKAAFRAGKGDQTVAIDGGKACVLSRDGPLGGAALDGMVAVRILIGNGVAQLQGGSGVDTLDTDGLNDLAVLGDLSLVGGSNRLNGDEIHNLTDIGNIIADLNHSLSDHTGEGQGVAVDIGNIKAINDLKDCLRGIQRQNLVVTVGEGQDTAQLDLLAADNDLAHGGGVTCNGESALSHFSGGNLDLRRGVEVDIPVASAAGNLPAIVIAQIVGGRAPTAVAQTVVGVIPVGAVLIAQRQIVVVAVQRIAAVGKGIVVTIIGTASSPQRIRCVLQLDVGAIAVALDGDSNGLRITAIVGQRETITGGVGIHDQVGSTGGQLGRQLVHGLLHGNRNLPFTFCGDGCPSLFGQSREPLGESEGFLGVTGGIIHIAANGCIIAGFSRCTGVHGEGGHQPHHHHEAQNQRKNSFDFFHILTSLNEIQDFLPGRTAACQ